MENSTSESEETLQVDAAAVSAPLRWADDPPDQEIEICPGVTFGDYVFGESLARGGFGTIYVATQRSSGRRVAIKVMHRELAQRMRAVGRFLREVEVVRLLRDPNIVEIYDTGTLPDNRPFYVMEYLEGETLRELIQRRGRLSPEEALDILAPVCQALETAHAAGIIHRDVKTSNIFITRGEPRRVLLLDFGIAKLLDTSELGAAWLTTVGQVVGTIAIMAPEQIRGERIDERTDIYALGVLLYAMLAGAMPFRSSSDMGLVRQHLEAPAPRPSLLAPVTLKLDEIVLCCLEKQPDRRFASVKSFIKALRHAVAVHASDDESAGEVRVKAVGAHLQLNIRSDSIDDEMASDIGRILDLAEERFQREGFFLLTTSDQMLAARPLPGDPEQARCAIRGALRAAASLYADLRRRKDADSRLDITVCMHVEQVLLSGGAAPEVVGGALAQTSTWAPSSTAGELCATREAIAELPEVELASCAGRLVSLTPGRDGGWGIC